MGLDGILNLDKPPGLTSARVVDRVKRLLPRGTKIGHAGTLDPFATGVLLLLIGKATRQCESLMNEPKQYETTIMLGATTATDDPESPPQPWPVQRRVERTEIEQGMKRFIGEIQQRPPAYSAIKIGGKRACDLARQGKHPNLQPRTVHVYRIDVLNYEWPLLGLRIDCGRGTYIRSIARDLGAALNVGGYLTELRRTRVGPFTIANAVSFEQLGQDGVAQCLDERGA